MENKFKTVSDVIAFYVGTPNNPLNGKTFKQIAEEFNVELD